MLLWMRAVLHILPVSQALTGGLQVCDRMMPGYGEQMRAISLK